MNSKNTDEGLHIFLWTVSYILSFIFIFSSIGIISGFDHIANGLVEEGRLICKYCISVCIFILIFILCTSLYTNRKNDIIWAYLPSLLFSTSIICYIISQSGIDCGKCSRLYLKDITEILDNSILEYTKKICLIIMSFSTFYTFVIIMKSNLAGYGYKNMGMCEIFYNSLCETVYYLLIMFIPLFICVICTLTGGDSSGIDCKASDEFNNMNKPHGLHRHDMV